MRGSTAGGEGGAEDDSPAPETMNGKMAEQEEPFIVETEGPSGGLINQTVVKDCITPTMDVVEEDPVSEGSIDLTVEEIPTSLVSLVEMDPAVHQIELTAVIGAGDTPADGEAAENLTAAAEAAAAAVTAEEEPERDDDGLVQEGLQTEVTAIVGDRDSTPAAGDTQADGEAAESLTAVAEAAPAAVTPEEEEELGDGDLVVEDLTAGAEAEQNEQEVRVVVLQEERENPVTETENLMAEEEEHGGGAAPEAEEKRREVPALDLCAVLQDDKENAKALEVEEKPQRAAAEYNGATSLRKLKAAVKEKVMRVSSITSPLYI